MASISRQSGLFSEVRTDPVRGGRRLVLTVTDYAGPEEGSAVATGLTFGLAGTVVTDRYHCEAIYYANSSPPITLIYEHALISKIGAVASAPPGLTPYPLDTAVTMLIDQIGWSVMRDLSKRGATEE